MRPLMEAAGARAYLPTRRTLGALRAAAAGCRGCGLYEHATQTVFGSGRRGAPLMLVGEQPGDREDRLGEPFVGPAGALLARALADAGIAAEKTYQTNAVKHFKFTRGGGARRIHQKPGRTEVIACRPWLLSEIEAVQPRLIVCLGATAAQALLGTGFRVSEQRGRVLPWPTAMTTHCRPAVVTTVHPAAVLRDRTGNRAGAYRGFVVDLGCARDAAGAGLSAAPPGMRRTDA